MQTVSNSLEKKEKIPIGGIFVNPIRLPDFIGLIDRHLTSSSSPMHITGVNPETFVHAHSDRRALTAIRDSDLINIDNSFVLLVLRLLKKQVPCRVATPDLFEEILNLATQKGYRVYILGAQYEVLINAMDKIKQQYSGINIVGFRDGYFHKSEEVNIVHEMIALKPQIIFLALPSPRKELFIYEHKQQFGNSVFLGIGGAIDVKAGKVVRAPLALRKLGLEGIHRAIHNPINYGKRYLDFYLKFSFYAKGSGPAYVDKLVNEILRII